MTDRPVLVTGMHRSGTTWVGDMLTLSPRARYVHEPFAPMNHRSWLAHLPNTRFLHLAPESVTPWEDDIRRVAALRPPWARILRRATGPRDVVRVLEDAARTRAARRRGARAVVKDPFALLCAEWVADRTNAHVVVLVRHPAAFVSSTLRLGWRLDERWLLGQSNLMAGDLAPFRDELEVAHDLDLLAQSCLVWRALNGCVARLRDRHPDWIVLRYEDLALAPVAGFRDLFRHVDLAWDGAVGDRIARANDASQGVDVVPGDRGGTRRDSRSAIWTWRDRLDAHQVAEIRASTHDVAASWYGEERWWTPEATPGVT